MLERCFRKYEINNCVYLLARELSRVLYLTIFGVVVVLQYNVRLAVEVVAVLARN